MFEPKEELSTENLENEEKRTQVAPPLSRKQRGKMKTENRDLGKS